MPLYEYRCKSCGHQFEKIQSFSAPEEKECPACHGPVERLISAPAVQFKGSGWYATDYASKGPGSMKASADANGKTSDSSSGDKPAAGKSEGSSAASSTPAPPAGKSE